MRNEITVGMILEAFRQFCCLEWNDVNSREPMAIGKCVVARSTSGHIFKIDTERIEYVIDVSHEGEGYLCRFVIEVFDRTQGFVMDFKTSLYSQNENINYTDLSELISDYEAIDSLF